jgi:intracellular multiplication protein IcmJ
MAQQPIAKTRSLPLLIPSVKCSQWRQDDPDVWEKDREYALVRRGILERDRYTCQYCGLSAKPDRDAEPSSRKASGYLEVHHLDDDHGNNDPQNLATICPFCHLVPHVGFAGNQKLAQLIYMPWLSQKDLNLLVAGMAVAILRGAKLGDDAEMLLHWLQAMDGPVIHEYGETMTDVAALGSALLNLHRQPPELYAQRGLALAHLRILPNPQMFQPAIAWWSQHGWIPGSSWQASWENLHMARTVHG